MERIGITSYRYKVDTLGAGIQFRQTSAWIGPLPLPPFLSPQRQLQIVPSPRGWHLEVTILMPLLGLIGRYEGALEEGAEVARKLPSPFVR